MPGEESKKFGYEPNFKWPPERYYNLAAYVLMFNGIANDHDDYGVENSNGDQFINKYIQEHLEELLGMSNYDVIPRPKKMPAPPVKPAHNPGVSADAYEKKLEESGYNAKFEKYKKDLKDWEEAKDYVYDNDKSPAANAKAQAAIIDQRAKEAADYKVKVKKLKDDLPNLISMAKELSRKANYDGKYLQNMLTNEQMAQVLREKYEGVRAWHEDVRKHVKGKSGKKDKDGQFDHWHDWDNAQAERLNKNKIVRRNGWRTFRRFAATALFGAVTLASVGALLSYGGFALTAMFGTAFNAAGVSGSVLGFIGTVAGGTFTKRFFGRFLDSMNEGRKLRRDRREFMKSFGKYSDKYEAGKTRQARGFRNIRQRYYEDMAIMVFLEKGGLDTSVKKGLKGKELREAKAKARLNRKLQVYLDRGLKRGTIMNPFADGGQPLDKAQLEKESRFYRFVTDKSDKQPYGFDHIFAKLAAAKSMNVNDVHSVQAHTAFTEEFLEGAENKKHTLEEIKLKLEELKRGESKFEGDNKDKYQELLYRFSDVIIDTMDRELFENSYNSDLVGTREDIYKVPEIKERYEKTREGDCTEHAENAFKFISNLRADTMGGGVLSDAVDASINDQVHIDRTHMENACSRYNVPQEIEDPATPGTMIPNPVYAAVQSACAQISAISSKGSTRDAAFTSVNDAIHTIETATPKQECNAKAATYLKYMRDKKLAETTHDAESLNVVIADKGHTVIPAAIRTSIASINKNTTPAAIAAIKTTIMSDATLANPANADARKFALELVQSQIEAIERKKRNEAVVGALPSIRNNVFHEYKEYIEKLPKDDVAEIDPENIAIVLKDFKKVLPAEMANFLVYRLKDKVASILKRRATSSKFDVTGGNYETAIDALRGYVRNIGICAEKGIIDEWQKNECSKAIEDKIISAFGPYLDVKEREFMLDPEKTYTLAEQYLKPMQNSGFGEFLDSGTPLATALRDRLKRLDNARGLAALMSASTKGADAGTLVCPESNETKAALKIYFLQSRTDGDVLYDTLKKMSDISATTKGFAEGEDPELISAMSGTEESIMNITSTGTGTLTLSNVDTQSYVYRMDQLLSTIKASTSSAGMYECSGRTCTPEDALAILLVMKKRTLAMLKAQMNRIYLKYKDTSDSMQNFAVRRAAELDRVKDKWIPISDKIDKLVDEIQAKVPNTYKGYYKCVDCVQEGVGKYSQYVGSNQMSI